MYCNNCGKKASGRFCSNCGQPLPNIDEQPSGDTKEWHPQTPSEPAKAQVPATDTTPDNTEQLRFSKVDEAVQRRSQLSMENMKNGIFTKEPTPAAAEEDEAPDRQNQKAGGTQVKKTVVRQSQKPSGKAVSKKKKTKTRRTITSSPFRNFSLSSLTGSAISSVLRYLSAGLMALLTLYTAAGFWSEKNTLGNIFKMTEESNYAMYAFSGFAGFILLFGSLSCLWILSRRRMADGRKMKRYDTGRGLASFFFFGLLTLLAKTLLVRLPSSPDYLRGITAAFQVFFVHRSFNLTLCLGGIVCCVLRGIKFH